jgi:hypothetical protein
VGEGVTPGAIYELLKRVRQQVEPHWRQLSYPVTIPGEGYRLQTPQYSQFSLIGTQGEVFCLSVLRICAQRQALVRCWTLLRKRLRQAAKKRVLWKKADQPQKHRQSGESFARLRRQDSTVSALDQEGTAIMGIFEGAGLGTAPTGLPTGPRDASIVNSWPQRLGTHGPRPWIGAQRRKSDG